MTTARLTLDTTTTNSAGFGASLRRAVVWLGGTPALWRRRARERRQLARYLSISGPGWLNDTTISCGEAVHEANKPFWRA